MPKSEPMGVQLWLQPNGPGLRLYNHRNAVPQPRTVGGPTPFATRTWYPIELQADGERIIGRLFVDSDNAQLLEQIECLLSDNLKRQHAGLIARGNGERVDWFQFGSNVPRR